MSDIRLNPCHCGQVTLQVGVSRYNVQVFCPRCGASNKTLPRNGITAYSTIAKARQYLVPKAIAEWNSYHKPKEDEL